MRAKRCRACRKLYQPHPQTYRQQKTCSKSSCRAWRRRQALRLWNQKHPLYHRGPSSAGQKLWRQNHPGYWKAWRKKHPGYVQRNRKAQKRRNQKNRGVIAKQNEWILLYVEKLAQIRTLRLIAKQNEWEELLNYKIDGICRIFETRLLIAKQNDTDKPLCVLPESPPS